MLTSKSYEFKNVLKFLVPEYTLSIVLVLFFVYYFVAVIKY